MLNDIPIIFASAKPAEMEGQRDILRRLHKWTNKVANTELAHCVMLALCCESAVASSAMRTWLEQEYELYNAWADKTNAGIDARKKLAKALRNNTLDKDHALLIKHNDPQKIAEQQADRAKLLKEAVEDNEYWDNQKYNRVDALRSDANKYTRLVRYAYAYDKGDDGTHVSTKARLVDHLVRHFEGNGSASVHDIAAYVGQPGGKTRLLKAARGNGGGVNGNDGSEDILTPKMEAAMLQAYREYFEAAAQNVTPLGIANFGQPACATGDLVLMLARQDAANTAVLTSLPLDNSLLEKFSAVFNKVMPIAVKPEVLFLSRFMSFKTLIPAGKSTEYTKTGTAAGDKAKESRVVVIYRDTSHQLNLLLTSQYSQSTPLVVAKLKDGLNIQFSGPSQLSVTDLDVFAKRLSSNISRPLLAASSSMANGQFELSLTQSVRQDADGKPDVVTVAFTPLAQELVKPIAPDHRHTDNAMTIGYADVKAFYDDQLAGWKNKTSGGNADVTFDKTGMLYDYKGDNAYLVPGHGASGSSNQLKFRGLDLYNAFTGLLEQPAQTFDIQVDIGGLLKIIWDDEFATYELCIPTVDEHGLTTRRFDHARF